MHQTKHVEDTGIQAAITFLRSVIAPLANEADRSSDVLRNCLKTCGTAGFLTPQIPVQFGGRDWSYEQTNMLKVETTRASGALSFLVLQLHGAAGILMRSENKTLQARILPGIVTGEAPCGIAFGHLRRQPPTLSAEQTSGGYIFNGCIPWATGQSFFPNLLIAAPAQENKIIYAVTPFAEYDTVKISSPLELATMGVTRTVEVYLRDLFIPDSDIARVITREEFERRDEERGAAHGYYGIGCSLAAIDYLQTIAHRELGLAKVLPKVLADVRKQFDTLRSAEWDLSVRADILMKMRLLVELCVSATGGAANLSTNPAQRLLRESIIWTTLGQGGRMRAADVESICRALEG